MSRRFQFSLRALLMVMLVVAAFFGGIRFERERRRRADEKEAATMMDNLQGGTFRQQTIYINAPDYRSPSTEALELRGFEGMTPRSVK
jgi:hypothetical protein